MLELKVIRKESELNEKFNRETIIEFLHEHLDRFRDSKEAISACLDYAFSTEAGKGGFIIAAYYQNQLVGVLVVNNTGMSGYIPDHILVYVAVDNKYRGQGFGRQIVEECFRLCEGDVKLHVEYDNPAKRLYERVGMTNKYAEMRYTKKK